MSLCSKTQVTIVLFVGWELKIKENFANFVDAAAVKIAYKKLGISQKVWKTKVVDMLEEEEYAKNVIESFWLKVLFKNSSKK